MATLPEISVKVLVHSDRDNTTPNLVKRPESRLPMLESKKRYS